MSELKALPHEAKRALPLFLSDQPIHAYRIWSVEPRADRGVLCSVGRDVCWPPRAELKATCLNAGRFAASRTVYIAHESPFADCECGIWGFREWERAQWALASYSSYGLQEASVGFVIGRVAMWGRVIETHHGYRAEYAYPQALEYLPAEGVYDHGLHERARIVIGEQYGVPVDWFLPTPEFEQQRERLTLSATRSLAVAAEAEAESTARALAIALVFAAFALTNLVAVLVFHVPAYVEIVAILFALAGLRAGVLLTRRSKGAARRT